MMIRVRDCCYFGSWKDGLPEGFPARPLPATAGRNGDGQMH